MGTILEKLQAVLNSKNAIKSSLSSKGLSPTDELSTYAPLIDTLEKVETEEKTVTPKKSEQEIVPSDGKYLSKVTVNGDSDLIASNIKSGVNIFGVSGSYKPCATGTATVDNKETLVINHGLDISKPKVVIGYDTVKYVKFMYLANASSGDAKVTVHNMSGGMLGEAVVPTTSSGSFQFTNSGLTSGNSFRWYVYA